MEPELFHWSGRIFPLGCRSRAPVGNEPGYEAWAWEIHHSAKKDAPSGTLLKLVDDMRKAGYTRRIDISSNRAGAMPGTHEIGFDSPADTSPFVTPPAAGKDLPAEL